MAAPTPLSLGISFGTDFIISAGGCLTTALVATGDATMPPIPVILFAVVTGLVAASRRIQAMLEQQTLATTKTTETDPSGVTRSVTMSAPPGVAAPKPVAPPVSAPPDPPKGVTP